MNHEQAPMTTQDLIDALEEQAAEIRGKLESLYQKLFQEGAAELFNKYENLEYFSWTQGTPSWNDGDPCHFRSHTDSGIIKINGLTSYEQDEDSEEFVPESAYDETSEFIDSFGDEYLEEKFGDNSEITVYPDSISIDGYEEGY